MAPLSECGAMDPPPPRVIPGFRKLSLFLVVSILSRNTLIAEGAHPNSRLKGAGPYTTLVLVPRARK